MISLTKMSAMSVRKASFQRVLKIEMTVCAAGFNAGERRRGVWGIYTALGLIKWKNEAAHYGDIEGSDCVRVCHGGGVCVCVMVVVCVCHGGGVCMCCGGGVCVLWWWWCVHVLEGENW